MVCSVTRFHYHEGKKRKPLYGFSWQGLHYPWAFHAQMPQQIVSVPRGTFTSSLSPPDVLQWLSDKRDMSRDSHVTISPLLSYSNSISWLLPYWTKSWERVFWDNKITAVVDDVMGICMASLSFTEPHNHKASHSYSCFFCLFVFVNTC